MKEQILNQLNLYVWAKDKSYRYLECNENYAKAAGLDSPHQIVGKTDDQLPWRALADAIKIGDYAVLQGHKRINSPETTSTVNQVTDILVTENQLLDASNQCVGVIGSFIDITGQHLVKKSGYFDSINKRYYLGIESLDDTYLTVREIEVLKRLLLGDSARLIGEKLKISAKTAEAYIETLKMKLQARNKGEIISTTIQFGLTHILHLPLHTL